MASCLGMLWALLLLPVTQAFASGSQAPTAVLHVRVTSSGQPVAGAVIAIADTKVATDEAGVAVVPVIAGRVEMHVTKDGFEADSRSLDIAHGARHALVVTLRPTLTSEEEVTVVSSTRTGRRADEQPMRVEVLDREEIEEKMLMTPGDIVMMLNEMGGMRVQATSPSLGAASVRIQGMRGRYTRILSDGLPLFGEVGGLGLLQIPPMDLGQVEVIKGVASALYGAGAMGGVINLLSRRPSREPSGELLFNRTSRGGTDAVTFLSSPLSRTWSASLLGGGHWQTMTDVNGEGWADLPGYSRAVVRPRIYWNNARGHSLVATAGFTGEARDGGTVAGAALGVTGDPYAEALETRRYDTGAVAQFIAADRFIVSARGAITGQRHRHQFGDVRERDRHRTLFGEVAVRGAAGRHIWVAGAAVEHDTYRALDVPRVDYTFTVPGIFAQYDVAATANLTVSASARLDRHSEYGTFLSPRVSALTRAGTWTSRLSVGTGFFAPTPLTEETEAAGLSRLLIQRPLDAERGASASFDVSRTDGPLSYTATLFASRVSSPLHVDRSPVYRLSTLPDATTNVGAELLGTMRAAPWSLTATYTFVRARETVGGLRDDVSLTPRHSAGLVAIWEEEDAGRVGLEWYYTGRQRLDENPYRDKSRPYMVVGLLAERQVGRMRVFINGENLTGVRQTRWDPLVRPARAVDGRWTVDAWAPLEGRSVNGGLRVRF